MANLTKDDVLKLARLSRLYVSDEEIDSFTSEISAILNYVEQLSSVDVDNLPPTYQVTGLKNVMRPDVINDRGITPSELLKNAPATEAGQFKVGRMIN